MNLLSVITEDELAMLNEILDKEIKHCKTIANRPIQGYGSVTELEKKGAWRHRAEEIAAIQEKLCNASM